MSAWIAGAIALPAFSALSLAMQRHPEQVFGRTPALEATVGWRLAGIVLLCLSLATCVASGWSGAVAATAWLGMLTVGTLVTGWILAYVPRHLLRIAGVSLGVALLVFFFQIGRL